MLVLREDAHLLDRLVAEDDCEAVDAGARHPRGQPLAEHAPPLRPPQRRDGVRDAASVHLQQDNFGSVLNTKSR